MRLSCKKKEQPKQPQQKKDEKEVIVFEQPKAYGWYTVIFPNVHDFESEFHLACWWNDAHDWLRAEGIKSFSVYARGTDKKYRDVMSPVFFFKDRMDAMRTSWRLSGIVIEA